MNNTLSFMLYGILNITFVLLVSPLFVSLIKKVKAIFQGRRGPSIFQTYYNLSKLLKKEVVYSSSSSKIMRVTPYLNIIVLLIAAMFVPLVFLPATLFGIGNIILFIYLLALAKFFMALSGLDAGSSFGGMASSREMTVSAVFEPIIIMAFAALAFVLKTTNIFEMFLQTSKAQALVIIPSIILMAISLFIVLIVETSRVPVDNPETHLELTMIHEGMILEQSGKNLALMEVSHAIKQTLLMGLLINILIPLGITTTLSIGMILIAMGAFLLKGAILAVIVGVFESSIAKLRLFKLPGLFILVFFFSFLTILFEVFT